MTIPVNFVAPALPFALEEYDQRGQEKFTNVLRLYFALIDNQTRISNAQLSSSQTLIWLNM